MGQNKSAHSEMLCARSEPGAEFSCSCWWKLRGRVQVLSGKQETRMEQTQVRRWKDKSSCWGGHCRVGKRISREETKQQEGLGSHWDSHWQIWLLLSVTCKVWGFIPLSQSSWDPLESANYSFSSNSGVTCCGENSAQLRSKDGAT